MERIKRTVPVINDVSQLLERLLLKEIPVHRNGIDISFAQPTRDWSARLSGPTLNLFLYDLRKNKLRQGQWETHPHGKNRAIQQRAPLKFDLNYVVTAWVIDNDPDEEHYLLSAALMALARHPRLPDPPPSAGDNDLLSTESRIDINFLPPGLQHQPGPIPLLVAEPDELLNPADIWGVLDNNIRPSISCTVTIALDPFQPINLELVQRRELRVKTLPDSAEGSPPGQNHGEQWPTPYQDMYRLDGAIQSKQPLAGLRLTLLRQGGRLMNVPVGTTDNLNHEFTVEQLSVGSYTLEILRKSHPPLPYEFAIPVDTGRQTIEDDDLRLTTLIKAT